MALFTKKPKTEKKVADVKVVAAARGGAADISHVIEKPRITEKATYHSAQGVYVFNIAEGANKNQVMRAVRAIYSVTPRKVNIVKVPDKSKRSARTGKLGTQGGGKKAYVYLKKGETITLN
jgi:large subunit ribosomal protein L23